MNTHLKNTIKLFNDKGIRYLVYKGYSHLDQDINFERSGGDIDIWIHPKDNELAKDILLLNGFHKLHGSNNSFIIFNYKDNTSLLFDICSKIRLGAEPYKPYYIDFDYNKLSLININGMYCLEESEYFPLQFLIRIMSVRDKKDSISAIESFYSRNDAEPNETEFSKYLYKMAGTSYTEVKKFIQDGDFILKKNRFIKTLTSSLNREKLAYLKQLVRYKYDAKLIFFRLLSGKLIKTRGREGMFVVFQGVDGSGKSSCIDFIEDQLYFKYSGMKSIYFGNNNYKMPLLNSFLKIKFKSKIINVIKYILITIDRQFRLLKVIYYKSRGFLVLGDRYFYDDLIYSKYNNEPSSSLFIKFIREILRKRIIIKPDILFFMDVSPEVAYSRKQDYSFKKMERLNANYKEFFNNLKNVNIERINADDEQRNVQFNVLEKIYIKQNITLNY